MGFACAAVIVFFLFLTGERVLLWYARKQFDLVIHVNGTRGKSTVTRMIHALLRSRSMDVYGKTTGSAARLLLPDGTERPVRRFGPANIREQRNVMITSAFAGKRPGKHAIEKRQKRALVLECNAVREELQYISMRLLRPDITVITNVRKDHVDELGDVEQAARIFAEAVPENSVLVTSDNGFTSIWESAASQKKLRFYYTDPSEAGDCAFPENAACVLAVADHLEIDRFEAFQSLTNYKPDAGAFCVHSWQDTPLNGSRPVIFADARAANDIESTNLLSAAALQTINPNAEVRRILLLVNREDRPDRTLRFTQYIINQHNESRFDQYLCLGHVPLAFRNAMKREGINCKVLRYIEDMDSALEETRAQTIYVFAVGNYGGKGVLITRWLETKRQLPEFSQTSAPSVFKAVQQ